MIISNCYIIETWYSRLVSKEVMFDFGDNINKASNCGRRGDTGSNHNPPLKASFNKTTPVRQYDNFSSFDEQTTDYTFYHGFLYEALLSR